MLQLIVEEGLHRGARVPLAPGRHSIGSGPEDDVLLADPGIVPGHLVLELGPQGCDLRIVGEGVLFPGHELPAPPGETWRLAADALAAGSQSVRVAGALLRLEAEGQDGAGAAAAATPAPAGLNGTILRLSRHPAAAMAGLAVAAVLLSALGVALHRPAANVAARQAPQPPDLQSQFAGDDRWKHLRVVKDATTGRVELQGAVDDRRVLQEALRLPAFERQEPAVKVVVKDELIRHVSEALQDTQLQLTLEPPAEGGPARLVVAGATTRPGVPSLLRLLKDEWAGRVEIVDRTSYAPAAGQARTLRVELPIRIAAVNVAERYIEASNGTRYFEGSAVGQDQTVESIGSERVVFNVKGRQVEFLLP